MPRRSGTGRRTGGSTSSPRRAGGPGARGEGRRFRTGRRSPAPRRAPRRVGRRRSRPARRPGELFDCCTPALRDVLELAVAVELVAEQVSQFDDAGPGTAKDLRQRKLVDLEEPELRVARGEQRGRDARSEVRARVVPCQAPCGGEDRRGHGRRRRLPVRRGDERDAEREPPGERVERAGVELPHELAGQRRPAAAAGGAREPPHEPGSGRFEREPGAHPAERTRVP